MRPLLTLVFLLTPAFGEPGSAFKWIQKVGSGRDSYVGLATDPLGNIFVVGNTRSPDFPVNSPLQPTLASPDTSDIFIVKLDPSGNVVFSTCFGGSAEDAASAMTVDPQGNLYVTGLTNSPDFPVTKGAYLAAAPPPDPLGQRGWSFLFKIDRDGTLGYSTYFTTSVTSPRAIAVDAAGSAYIAGSSTGRLPVTPGAYQPVCDCGFMSIGSFTYRSSDGFVARFDPAGSKLVYATYLGATAHIGNTVTSIVVAAGGSAYIGAASSVCWLNPDGSTMLGQGSSKIVVKAMALGRDGALYLAGAAVPGLDGFLPTAGAAQAGPNIYPPLDYQIRLDQQSAIVKMDGSLQNTLAATYFGGPYGTSILSVAVDGSGSIFVGGSTASHGLPTSAPIALGFGSEGTGFAAELSADLSTILFSSYFGDSEHFDLQTVSAAADGTLVLGGVTSNPHVSPAPGTVWVNRVTIAPPQVLRIDSVLNAASHLDDPISGGETILVRGAGFDSAAQLLIGATVVNPIAVTSGEIAAVMPADLAEDTATLRVQSAGSLSNAVLVPVAAATPGLFSIDRSGAGQGYILNQDGALNGPDHPAQPGERITIFATGVGPVTFDQSYAVTATPVAVSVDIFYARGVAAILAPVDGFPGDVYQLTAYVPTYAEIAEALPALASFKYPPQVGVILRIAGRASQNGLAISIAQ
jgi:uncharacterized protein (TIGR03437 family)